MSIEMSFPLLAYASADWVFFKGALLLGIWTVMAVVGGYGLYFLLSVPFRRTERALVFLELLEGALERGEPTERMIMSASQSRDYSLGARFHLLAAHLERGLNLEQALAKVPRMLPPQVLQMIRAGLTMGDVRRVLPACRQLLRDTSAQVRKGQSYLVLFLCVVGPWASGIIGVLNIFVFPKFQAIAADMMEMPPMSFAPLMAFQQTWSMVSLGVMFLVWFGVLLYVGGPRVPEWIGTLFPGFYDALESCLPWRKKRLQRDFAAMLAVLLDAGFPEDKAVAEAALCTANRSFIRRGERAVADIRSGVKLTEAVRRLDDAGEFHWRLTNAAAGFQHSRAPVGTRSIASFGDTGKTDPGRLGSRPYQSVHGDGAASDRGKFTTSLAGWQESLDARAFQQEQAATHVVTTALVFWNGLIVAATTWCVFKFLTDLIWEGTTW